MPGLKRAARVNRLTAFWSVDVDDYVTALAWSPDGRTLAAAAANGPVFLLDGATGRTRRVLAGHLTGTLAVDWSRDGRWLATGGRTAKSEFWEADSGAQVAALDGGAAWVEHVAWSPTSDTLAAAAGKHLRLWQADGSVRLSIPPCPATITGVQWRTDGGAIASSCYGGVRIWHLGPTGVSRQQVLEWKGPLIALRWSPDGKHVACGGQDASVHVWDTETGDELEMTGYALKVRELAWDSHGRYLATGGGANAVVWDFSGKGPAGSKPKVLAAHADRITDMAFRPGRPVLVTGAEDGAALFWVVTDPKNPLGVALEDAPVSRVAWQPGGERVAVGYASGRVAAWPAP